MPLRLKDQIYATVNSDAAYNGSYKLTFPNKAGTIALTSDIPSVPTVNNGQLTIQKNGTNVQTFTANQSGNVTANITVPTKTSDLTNDSGYITSYTDTQVTQTRVDPSEVTTFYPVASASRLTDTGDVKKFGAVKLNYKSDDGGYAELELGESSYYDPVGGELTLWNMSTSQNKTTLHRGLGATNQTFNLPYNADSTFGTLVANGTRNAATGSATQPVYADATGILHPTTYALNKTVPSNAVFTDTTYSDATTSTAGLMSASDKSKLNGIAAGAEVNVQSDWNVTNTSSDAFIKNKPTIPTVNNGTLTIQKNGTSVGTFTANQSGNSTANITVPTKTSDLTNDSGFIDSVAWGDVTGKPTFATVATSGSYNDLSNKPTIPTVGNATLTIQKNGTNVQTFTANATSNKTANITVPTKTSDLTNDSNFVASTALATVATSGSYNDLSNKPTIPTVNNATLTIQKNGSTVKTFTANASSNVTANITVPTALSDLSGTVSSSQIADDAVTSDKIDWSSLGHHHTASSTQTAIGTSNTTLLSFQLTAGTWLLIGTSDFNHANTATGDAFIGFWNLTANTAIGNMYYFNELNNGTYWSVETAHEVVTLTSTANVALVAKKGQGTLYSTRKSFTAIRIG